MADAVSPKEAEFMEWLKSSAWSDWRHHATNKAALFDAFEAGERKERERSAKLAEDHSIDGWHLGDEIAEEIRGGESTT